MFWATNFKGRSQPIACMPYLVRLSEGVADLASDLHGVHENVLRSKSVMGRVHLADGQEVRGRDR